MSFCSFRNSILERLLPPHPRWPVLLYAAAWTSILTATVAMASFTPEIAFVSAVTPTSSLSKACSSNSNTIPGTSIRLPLDIPSHNFCFPSHLFKRSGIDMLVPPIFAAVIVAASACAVKAMGLWEDEDHHRI